MTIECTKEETATVVKVAGRMDAESAPQFEQACEECIRDGAKNLAVDVAELKYVSSMGLRSFLMIAKALQSRGGKMMLCGLRGVVKEVFDMTHLTALFPVFDSTAAAIASI
jgi:anti-anti-sigma factor